jgi:hypothetical protein
MSKSFDSTAAIAFKDWKSLAQTDKSSQGAGIPAAKAAFHAFSVRQRLPVGLQELMKSYHKFNGIRIRNVFEVTLAALPADRYAKKHFTIMVLRPRVGRSFRHLP